MSGPESAGRKAADSVAAPPPAVPPLPPEAYLPPRESAWWRSVFIGAVRLALGLALFGLIWLLRRPIALFILALAIAAALNPLVEWMSRRIPRILAVILIVLAVLLVIAGIGWIVFPPLIEQARQISERMPEYIVQLQDLLDRVEFLRDVNLSDTLLPAVGQFGSAIVMVPVQLASFVFEIALILIFAIYTLLEIPDMSCFVRSLFPADRADRMAFVFQRMGRAMGGYARGVAITASIVGLMTYLGLLIIGVDFPLVLGLIAAAFEILPFIGPLIAAVPILTLALLDSFGKAVGVAIFLILVQQVESNIITPNVMHAQTKIPPLVVVAAITIGGTIGGLLWAIAAIPLFAALRVLARRVIAPAIRRRTGAPEVILD